MSTAPLPVRLLTALAADGASPRLTWYGVDGERTELSGRVLANWATKAANLLLEEADAEPGTRVLLDLPVHWRTLVWALGTWTAGATVVLPGDGAAGCEVVVTSRPGQAADGAELVLAVALPALAMRWDGAALPAGAVDAAAELMTYGDQLGFVQEPGAEDLALAGPVEVRHGDLTAWTGADVAAGERALLAPGSLAELLARATAIWVAGGSVVLAGPGHDDEQLAGIAEVERATR